MMGSAGKPRSGQHRMSKRQGGGKALEIKFNNFPFFRLGSTLHISL